jgi:hypothetical protein
LLVDWVLRWSRFDTEVVEECKNGNPERTLRGKYHCGDVAMKVLIARAASRVARGVIRRLDAVYYLSLNFAL